MRVIEAIDELLRLPPEANIVFTYWMAEHFGKEDDEDWENLCEFCAYGVDWDAFEEQIAFLYDSLKNGDIKYKSARGKTGDGEP